MSAPEDIFIPKSKPADALVEQLHTVTVVTSDKDGTQRAFLDGYGLDWSGWQSPERQNRAQLNAYFGLTGTAWQMAAFYKKGIAANIAVRVIYTPDPAPQVRTSYDGLINGGATISFPKADLRAHEKTMKACGFTSTMGVKELEFQSPTGELYTSAEIIYYAMEHCYLLAVKRPEIFVPVGPIEPGTGLSAPAYSARCISDAGPILEFMQSVLGFEVRRDVVFPIGDQSAMLLPQGSKERFIQVFAPGASTGYMVLMDHFEDSKPPSTETLGPPSRGIVMWSYKTKDLGAVYTRALEFGADILRPPGVYTSPYLDLPRSMILKDPGGFPLEIFGE